MNGSRSMENQFKKLSFLIGRWKGKGEGFDSGKDTEIANTLEFSWDPSPSIITGRFEAQRAGKLRDRRRARLLEGRQDTKLSAETLRHRD